MKLHRLLAASIIAVLLISSMAIFTPKAKAYPGTHVSIDPGLVEKYTDTTSVGDTFQVKLIFGNMTDLAGIEYKITWKSDVLNLVAIQDNLPWSSYYVATNVTTNNYNATNGRSWVSIVSTSGPFTGSSLNLRIMTFKIMSAPSGPGFLSSYIDIYDDIFGDSGANPIPHTTNDGLFKFYFVMPPLPDIKADSFTATFVGQTFDLPVRILNVDALWQVADVYFELTYDTTLLDATGLTEGPFFSGFGTTTFSYTVDDLTGVVSGHVVLTAGPPPFPSGSGVIATIQFTATYGEVGNILTCPLHLQNVVVKDFSAVNIGYHALIDGLYTIAIPSPAKKAIGVYPPATTVVDEGVLFTIQVRVYNISSADKFFGVQFSLDYDSTLMELISVAEGPFLASFPWRTPPEEITYFQVYTGTGTITLVNLLLNGGPEPPGYIYPTTNPENTIDQGGIIAYITFRSTVGTPGETVVSTFDLHDPIFGDYSGLPIPVELIHDGTYQITLDKRYIDVYTQYPEPFGGQKRFHDADAYSPQDLVCLYVKLTYNRWPIPNKPVELEIHGPENPVYNITFYVTVFTDPVTGIAVYCFRIPWPDVDAETQVFGTWTVYASADVDGIKITDILHFEVGWLIQIDSITLNEPAYKHLWVPYIRVDYHSISLQGRPVTITVSIFDEVGYPLGSMTVSLTAVGYGPHYVTLTGFRVPYWARAGTGVVRANAYTALPSMSGVAYCPEVSVPFVILAA
ncbi:hypothetical protein HXY32_00270 [Candidatus Bathyarchaeota archaeon]|nr:hypothetical protein [Candidatus Bathyarchaeota archaeon]